MIILNRPCAWCGLDIPTKRSHTKLHSNCHVPMHRARQKLMPGEGPAAFFTYIAQQLAQGTHPNPKHPIYNKEEEDNAS